MKWPTIVDVLHSCIDDEALIGPNRGLPRALVSSVAKEGFNHKEPRWAVGRRCDEARPVGTRLQTPQDLGTFVMIDEHYGS